jgi:hypothetical protein
MWANSLYNPSPSAYCASRVSLYHPVEAPTNTTVELSRNYTPYRVRRFGEFS